jgi:hypothetical protein
MRITPAIQARVTAYKATNEGLAERYMDKYNLKVQGVQNPTTVREKVTVAYHFIWRQRIDHWTIHNNDEFPKWTSKALGDMEFNHPAEMETCLNQVITPFKTLEHRNLRWVQAE